MKILIGADIVPTNSNAELFRNGDSLHLLGEELQEQLNSADFRIFNLEVPLTDRGSPISKCGPHLMAPKDTVNGYKAIGCDLLTLANNHILDQGESGFRSTCETLRSAGIGYVGAGDHLEEARRPYIFECGGKKIGVYACAEHEFSIATGHSAGANPFDALESPDHIAELDKTCDFVIVLYHGGKEHYRYPSPNLQKVCRKFVEKGADLVVCQHSHCIGCEEKYLDGTIVYGQGNFLFDHSESEYWQTSLLIRIDDDLTISYLPLVKCENKVRLADKARSEEIMFGFRQRSEEIKQDGFIEQKYGEFAEAMRCDYLIGLSGLRRSFVFRALNKLSGHRFAKWFIKRRYDKDSLLAIQNIVECEAHRELLLKGISDHHA